MENELKKKTLSGFGWTIGRLFSVQLSTFLVQLVLARILLPEAFGLIAMLQVFISVSQSLLDGGMTSSLIRSPSTNQVDLSTVFFTNLTIGIALYVCLYFLAGPVAEFYNQPSLVAILRVYGTSVIIQALAAVQLAKLTKEMNFKLQTILEIPAVVISCILGVWMAFNGYGVWSLVWMALGKSMVFTLQVWLFAKWTPSLIFDWVKFKYHFNFGYKLTLSSILNTIYDNLYNIIIGKFFSVAQLGYYDRASSLRMLPVQTISSALNKVTYPVFSSIQDDNAKLKRTYRALMQQVVFWVAPLMTVAAVIAEPLFVIVLTDKWLPAVPYFRILCFAAILYPLHAYNLNILNVKGRSDLFLRLEIIKKILITACITLTIPFGIYGLLYAQLLTTVLGFFINSYYSGRLIAYSALHQIKDIAPTLIIAGLCGLISVIFNNVIVSHYFSSNIANIFLNIAMYGILYLFLSILLRIPAISDFKRLILKK